MSKLRIYYDKEGNIQETEHRVDEEYSDENASRDDANWIVVESEDFNGEPPELFLVRRQKLAKKR